MNHKEHFPYLNSEEVNMEKPNPFLNSINPNALHLDPAGFEYSEGRKVPLYKDQEGNTYYGKIERKDIPRDYSMDAFVSTLSKSILRTPDVFLHEGEYRSRKMDTAHLPVLSEQESRRESDATNFMLYYMFANDDHSREPSEYRSEGEFNNILQDAKTKQPVFIDFEDAYLGADFNYVSTEEELRNELQAFLVSLEISMEEDGEKKVDLKIPEEDRTETIARIRTMTKRFLNEVFPENDEIFFHTAIDKSKVDLFSENFSFLEGVTVEEKEAELFSVMRRRLVILQEELNRFSGQSTKE
jgi:hypothetical protein